VSGQHQLILPRRQNQRRTLNALNILQQLHLRYLEPRLLLYG
jgi:hypothetical protein